MPEEPLIDWDGLLGGMLEKLTEPVPLAVTIGIGVFVVMAGIGLVFRALRKSGVKG